MAIYDNNRFAKIVCTLGPSSNTYEKIKKLALAGMNVARLNFSHGTHKQHEKVIKYIRKVSDQIGRPIAILQDLQGPKIRVMKFEKGEVKLKNKSDFILTVRKVMGNEKIVSVSYSHLHKDVKPGDFVLLDDGNIRLRVRKIENKDVHCRVIFGGILKDHKGLNLPGSILSVQIMTPKDDEDLKFGLENDVDYVALSFVQKPSDIAHIKNKILKAGKHTPVVAKIEKPQAVEAIDKITDLTDVIMVARGDLGVEMDTEEVPHIQKEIISICNLKGVPVITATQMLESMIHNPRPTRAEASDVANAVLDGSDAVMLSGETAAGKFPVEAVKTMSKIICLIEKNTDIGERRISLRRKKRGVIYDSATTIGYSACHAAEMIGATVIVCLTQSGSSANMIARFRSDTPIIAISPRIRAYYRSALVWGVSPILTHEFKDLFSHTVDEIIEILKAKKMVKKNDRLIITAGLPFTKMLKTNAMRIETVH
ncbi:MAG: pyruvate kinase [bacterium]|nr:pyruvate kinase [bacterium]